MNLILQSHSFRDCPAKKEAESADSSEETMSSLFLGWALFLWQILFVFCLPREEITRNEETWIGRALWENPKSGELLS